MKMVKLDEGRAFVYHGSSSGLSASPNWTAESNKENGSFGWSVSTAGDINGDGYSDVVIGAPYYEGGQINEGRAYLYRGSSAGLSASANWMAESNQANAYFGCSVSTAGDVNGDGYSDVIIGAYGYDNDKEDEGGAYVYYGSSGGLSYSANWMAEGNQIYTRFGWSVSTTGDVNGDGYSDIVIGAPFYYNSLSGSGSAFVYYGSSSGLSASANWIAEMDRLDTYFGACVSTAGDVNGDGYSDIIIGAYAYDNGVILDGGRVFVYYGNNGGGLRSTQQQYRAGTSIVIGPDGKTGTNGQVRFNGFAKSPFGRADGKLVYEYAANGSHFGSMVNSSGSQSSYTDLGTTISGVQLNQDVSGIPTMKNYRWRERIKYRLVNNPYQVYGPWRYYTSYQPFSFGSFKPQNVPLPVELATFAVTSIGSSVTLHWRTATEVNNYGFEVEIRRIQNQNEPLPTLPYRGGEGWGCVGFVAGAGTSNSPQDYTYTDENLSSGRYAYRLKQVDQEGTFKYWQSLEVEIGLAPRELTLSQNYPNPFNPSTTIEFTLAENGNVTLKIFDMLGREVATLVDGERKAGKVYKEVFDASKLASGLYFYWLQTAKNSLVKKLMLMK